MMNPKIRKRERWHLRLSVDSLEGNKYIWSTMLKPRTSTEECYVYLDDKETMVERILLSMGYAEIMTVQPNSKYADEFYEIQKQAREARVGFWGTDVFN